MTASPNARKEERNSGYVYFEDVLGKPEFVLAPMVDQSELPYRILARAHGADLCFTPMIHANVFARDNRYRCEHLSAIETDRPLIAQFCANAVQPFIDSIRLIAPFVDGVDLNLGCPQMIAKKGNYGAYLQDDWATVHKLVSAAHEQFPGTPISVKIRVFDDDMRTVQYARMIEAAGAQMLTVHGRTREMRGERTGLADWDKIALVKRSVSIPVIANGNIQEHDDLQRCLRATGCDAVMSAEGHLHNPLIFEEHTEHVPHWSIANEYMQMCDKYPTSTSAVRAHLFKLFHHTLCVYNDVRESLAHAGDMVDLRRCVHEVQRRCQPLHAQYIISPKTVDTNGLPLPHWLCQPHYRAETIRQMKAASSSDPPVVPPGVVVNTIDKFALPLGDIDKQIAQRLDARKRRADALTELSKASGLSIKMVRKFERQVRDSSDRGSDLRALGEAARQRFEAKANKFAICSCLSPLSTKCDNTLCKKCCKQDCIENKANCVAHQFWYGDKSGLREQMLRRRASKAPNKPSL